MKGTLQQKVQAAANFRCNLGILQHPAVQGGNYLHYELRNKVWNSQTQIWLDYGSINLECCSECSKEDIHRALHHCIQQSQQAAFPQKPGKHIKFAYSFLRDMSKKGLKCIDPEKLKSPQSCKQRALAKSIAQATQDFVVRHNGYGRYSRCK